MSQAKAKAPAPWSPLLKSHLTSSKSKSFTLSTVTHHPTTGLPVPRSRTCELRGFFPDVLSLHPSAASALDAQGIGRIPSGLESDMPVFTTDIRMAKVGELGVSGGQVEGVLWLEGVQVQWRVKGGTFVFGGEGTFRNPPPGQPRSKHRETSELKIGQKVEDLRDPVARRNFRVVVIRPEEVEMLDLSKAPDAVRKRWTVARDGDTEKWEEVELWP
ncbi:hypothetical protein ASPACDRAFT_41608 [Aspergillus aculeatus ATCC 16872]|uniref:Pyridoxamine 5'-phosphate oxidase Alr4036 family FMN-binding domain-containing protein n=1 Tax=Aspergillus aculeatus (strain ATCC 16872 / CBS 172.66 / WB 5094) TaxID=690307 RepID=A0A1L9WYN1_ASPA1|nr:uncharacterized protein ASPACDRAFT_41608 [Aspergillus aculeatus ATCC 16872]OJK01347.1 hypothetical protein ASPACDRAFT_41608 [Aspergillus aculeatus ATCC 16872]